MDKNKENRLNKDIKIDKPLFLGSIILLLAVSIPIIMNPEAAMEVVNSINAVITKYFGNWYVWFAFFALIVAIWFIFGKYGNIKLGDPDTKPEYSTFSWIAMLFCGGLGGTLIYWGFIEWIYYFQDPPLYYEAGTWAAAELSAALGPYHWAFMSSAIYIIGAAACGYMIYVRKINVFRISEACRGAFGDKVDGILGRIIDIGFIFGLVGGSATAFSAGTPLITALFSELTGIPDNNTLKVVTLIVIAAIFACTSYLGVSKGLKFVSDWNIRITIAVLIAIMVLGAGGLVFTLDMTTTAVGIIAQNFIQLNSWMDPGNVTNNYPESWSVYMWSYSTVYAPFYGLFYARISKGRTIKQMILGTVGSLSVGCIFVFLILSSFGINMHMTGEMDLIASLNEAGGPYTIISMIDTLPAAGVFKAVILFVMIAFVVTTYDATSGVLASVSQTRVDESGESKRWLRLVWAAGLVALPTGFILAGSPLTAIQTIVIICALPCTFVCIALVKSFIGMVKQDEKDGKFSLKTGWYNKNGLTKEQRGE